MNAKRLPGAAANEGMALRFECNVPKQRHNTSAVRATQISVSVITQQSGGARKYPAVTCYLLLKSTKLQNN